MSRSGEAARGSLVSAVIPVYDGERYLAEAIGSVLAQSYPAREIVVVDDGSTDASAAIARSFPEVRYLHQSNQGAGAARNVGVAACRGEFVAFLDADDVWTPDKLSIQTSYLLEHPEVGYVVARGAGFLEDGLEIPAWVVEDGLTDDYDTFPFYLPSTLMVRKPVFYRVGEFERGYVVHEDVDWFFRARELGVPGFVVPRKLARRRLHDSNLSYRTEAHRNQVLLKIARKTIGRRRSTERG